MLGSEDLVNEFKKTISATLKSIGKSNDVEVNFVNETPSINGKQVNLTSPSIASLKNNLNLDAMFSHC